MTWVVLVMILVMGYQWYQQRNTEGLFVAEEDSYSRTRRGRSGSSSQNFRCDGRTYCSQMTSCAEAKYFLQHCPNVKMDGDRNGIPCEKQWCR